MKAARFLCARLNARVQAEDEILTRSVQRGLASGAYTQGILSDKEIVLAGFQDWIRERLPVTQLDPGAGTRHGGGGKCGAFRVETRDSDRAQVPLVVPVRDLGVEPVAFLPTAGRVQFVVALAEVLAAALSPASNASSAASQRTGSSDLLLDDRARRDHRARIELAS